MTKSQIKKINKLFLPSPENGQRHRFRKTYTFYSALVGPYSDGKYYVPETLIPAQDDAMTKVSVEVTDPRVSNGISEGELITQTVGLLQLL